MTYNSIVGLNDNIFKLSDLFCQMIFEKLCWLLIVVFGFVVAGVLIHRVLIATTVTSTHCSLPGSHESWWSLSWSKSKSNTGIFSRGDSKESLKRHAGSYKTCKSWEFVPRLSVPLQDEKLSNVWSKNEKRERLCDLIEGEERDEGKRMSHLWTTVW